MASVAGEQPDPKMANFKGFVVICVKKAFKLSVSLHYTSKHTIINVTTLRIINVKKTNYGSCMGQSI